MLRFSVFLIKKVEQTKSAVLEILVHPLLCLKKKSNKNILVSFLLQTNYEKIKLC